jgi:hypothetical protein
MGDLVDGKVNTREVYSPKVLYLTSWFQTWAFKCGKCSRDVVRFAMFGQPVCPFCQTKNVPPEYSGV